MSATAPRLAQGTSDQRRLFAVLGMVALAVAILVAVAFGQQVLRSSTAPAANGAHDLIVKGTNGGAIRYTGIPYPAPAAHKLVVSGTNGGGIEYTGIPYPIPGVRQSTNTIPYPIPGVRQVPNTIPYPIPGFRKATNLSTPAQAGHGTGGLARIKE